MLYHPRKFHVLRKFSWQVMIFLEMGSKISRFIPFFQKNLASTLIIQKNTNRPASIGSRLSESRLRHAGRR